MEVFLCSDENEAQEVKETKQSQKEMRIPNEDVLSSLKGNSKKTGLTGLEEEIDGNQSTQPNNGGKNREK